MVRSLRRYKAEVAHDLAGQLLPFGESLANALGQEIASFIETTGEKPRFFGIKVCREGVTGLRFNIKAAMVAAISLVGGVVGANPISAGAAVVCCLFALHEGVRSVPDMLARIVLLLHEQGGSTSFQELAAALRASGANSDESELRERLMDLELLGVVAVQSGTISLKEVVVVPYREREMAPSARGPRQASSPSGRSDV